MTDEASLFNIITAVGTGILGIAAIVSLWISIANTLLQRKANYFNSLMKINDEMKRQDFKDAENTLHAIIRREFSRKDNDLEFRKRVSHQIFELQSLDEQQYSKIVRYLEFYSYIGVLVKQKMIPAEETIDIIRHKLDNIYGLLYGFLNEWRDDTENYNIFSGLELLLCLYKIRYPTHPDRTPRKLTGTDFLRAQRDTEQR